MPSGERAASLFALEFRPVADPSLQIHLALTLAFSVGTSRAAGRLGHSKPNPAMVRRYRSRISWR
jgi:hypothetical protein